MLLKITSFSPNPHEHSVKFKPFKTISESDTLISETWSVSSWLKMTPSLKIQYFITSVNASPRAVSRNQGQTYKYYVILAQSHQFLLVLS